MTDDHPPTPPRRSTIDARREREAEALRANLRRRKEQQRAREEHRRPDADPAAEEPPLGG